jgi:hypothetical protein
MKRKGIIIILAVLFCVVLVVVLLRPISKGALTTRTSSSQFSTQQEKLQFLKKYLTFYSDVYMAEYYIDFQDNSYGLVPGPSEWDIIVSLKVPKDSIKKWIDGFQKIEPNEIDLNVWDRLNLVPSKWSTKSKPAYYKRPDQMVYLVVYDEGIIFKRVAAF